MHEKDKVIDDQLWHRFIAGDDPALEIIYRRYFDDLYYYGLRLAKEPAIIEDAIQELFVKLMRNRNKLAEQTVVKYYLMRSLRNTILDQFKATNKIDYVVGENLEEQFDLSFEHELIVHENIREADQKLKVALEALTDRQREAIYL